MGEIVGFVSKSELERVRLIREARGIYDSIFPPANALGERTDGLGQGAQPADRPRSREKKRPDDGTSEPLDRHIALPLEGNR
jgi:hypothetical protein